MFLSLMELQLRLTPKCLGTTQGSRRNSERGKCILLCADLGQAFGLGMGWFTVGTIILGGLALLPSRSLQWAPDGVSVGWCWRASSSLSGLGSTWEFCSECVYKSVSVCSCSLSVRPSLQIYVYPVTSAHQTELSSIQVCPPWAGWGLTSGFALGSKRT